MKGGTRGREGVSALTVLILITAAAALGIAAAAITRGAQISSVDFLSSAADYYAAQSGLEWFNQITDGYTTADRDKWEALDGASRKLPGGETFTLTVEYSDSDDDPSTDDLITVSSTGASDNGAGRTTRMTVAVPADSSGAAIFSDHFDQGDTSLFDSTYVFGSSAGAHSSITPFKTVLDAPGGDSAGEFTHSSETGGVSSVMVMGGGAEARFTISGGECLKWSMGGGDSPCNFEGCANTSQCQAREGLNLETDDEGFHNYFIKIRARFVQGKGFGVYFRASYPGENNPYSIDFSGLTSYIWQYDTGMGYLPPCDMYTAVAGSDGEGMFFTRQVTGGSETCGPGCEVFQAPSPSPDGYYPFFCPENRTGLEFLNGWRWRNQNWIYGWRTVYIYVYRNRADVYLGLEEAAGTGGENNPEHVGRVWLDHYGPALRTGGIGVRAIENSLIELDYIKIYDNDEDNDPLSFPGEF